MVVLSLLACFVYGVVFALVLERYRRDSAFLRGLTDSPKGVSRRARRYMVGRKDVTEAERAIAGICLAELAVGFVVTLAVIWLRYVL